MVARSNASASAFAMGLVSMPGRSTKQLDCPSVMSKAASVSPSTARSASVDPSATPALPVSNAAPLGVTRRMCSSRP
jgi:hypothetical protein